LLEARGVTYRYPLTDDYRIKNVSFTLRQGEKVAFVGENGAGKTTFIKLLTGMLEPSGGEIMYNPTGNRQAERQDNTGKNITGEKTRGDAKTDSKQTAKKGKKKTKISSALNKDGFTPDSLLTGNKCESRHGEISCVFQKPNRFNTFTIADNVFLGDVVRARDEEAIDRALAFSGFDGAGRDEMLGKNIGGTELSGGQWQKLAIARAYYRSRDFFVLDEPTSNLDPLAEAEVFTKYLKMAEEKTVIMVTHRISVASLADRVVVFKDGEIIEDGSHEELLSQNGEYARLYSTQAKWYDR
jgi:ATP-binding cassette subfamily B protein